MHYDPMIAKLSVHAADREAAIARARAALRGYAVLGVATNIEYLDAILADGEFAAGRLHTGLLDQQLAGWSSGRGADARLALALAAVAEHERRRQGPAAPDATAVAGGGPWQDLGRFRLGGLD